MCIAIVTTAHPRYPFILLNNRDEYIHRPTAPAQWREDPDSHVLGGFDLHRPVHGTWLGVTRQGRIACLTNFREEGQALIQDSRSRGAIVNAFLKTPPSSTETTEQFAQRLVEEDGVKGVGGFSLLYGRLQDIVKNNGKGLAIVSNRTPDVDGLVWLAESHDETHALSNSHYGDQTWPKIVQGEESTKAAIEKSVHEAETKDQLIERLFDVLSVDTLPTQKNGEEWDIYLRQLRNSIFIPLIGNNDLVGKSSDEIAAARGGEVVKPLATSGVYGTQRQTVIVVDKWGKAVFVERSLTDENGKPVDKGSCDRRFDFQIEDWPDLGEPLRN
ncbi:DUF833-domain-containing protein [Saccharata proteae CBS 121410]|uniref:DUF833-domain-containing protein n=1 Tax=Saccharata proteae CBS 121410 TaxID=1314787 RepID=A0A9P4HU76_9PEZI|nr:DUF833-domain-containing protein [Saccharata proteae CBS 121410]